MAAKVNFPAEKLDLLTHAIPELAPGMSAKAQLRLFSKPLPRSTIFEPRPTRRPGNSGSNLGAAFTIAAFRIVADYLRVFSSVEPLPKGHRCAMEFVSGCSGAENLFGPRERVPMAYRLRRSPGDRPAIPGTQRSLL